MQNKEKINMIVAVGRDGAIGKGGDLIWQLPGDLKRFKTLTMNHPVIMGRKTWESLPKRPLPGRRNIVVTRNADWSDTGAEKVSTVQEAIASSHGESPFIIGGGEIYREFLPVVSDLYLTFVDADTPDADVRLFIDFSQWVETERSEHMKNEDGITYRYITLTRKEA